MAKRIPAEARKFMIDRAIRLANEIGGHQIDDTYEVRLRLAVEESRIIARRGDERISYEMPTLVFAMPEAGVVAFIAIMQQLKEDGSI